MSQWIRQRSWCTRCCRACGACIGERSLPSSRRVLIAPRLLSAIPCTRLVSDAAMRKMLVSALSLWIWVSPKHLDDSIAEVDAGCVDAIVAIEKESSKAYLWLPLSEEKKSYTVETPCLARFLSLVDHHPLQRAAVANSPPPDCLPHPSFRKIRYSTPAAVLALHFASPRVNKAVTSSSRRRGSLQPTPASCWTLLIPDSVVITCPKSHHGGHPHPSLQWDHS